MAEVRKYKKMENSAVYRASRAAGAFFARAGRAIASAFRALDSKITIMIVPHANGKSISLQTNAISIALGFIILLAIVLSFVYFGQSRIAAASEISSLKEENSETLASLDEMRDESASLLESAEKFRTSLSRSLSLLGIDDNTAAGAESTDGAASDLASVIGARDAATGQLKEVGDMKMLSEYLEDSAKPIEEIARLLENQGTLFSDIPSVWPVKGGIGHVSMEFGQNIHPITRQWYIHKGMDFSTWRQGDPVVATADGQVTSVTYDESYGLNIIIKHKHGIYTRYAHLGTSRVRKGDAVSQNQTIGTIGNTGITTGPHLHYEVHIGSDVVDPAKFVSIK